MGDLVFWDVDTQYDFIYPDGKLYVQGAEEIIPNLERLTRYAQENAVQIIGSVDYHSLEDEEIAEDPDFNDTFPPHCMTGTAGQTKIDATRPQNPLWIDYAEQGSDLEQKVRSHRGEIFFQKRRFDVFSNPNVDRVLRVVRPSRIVLYGVTLDICDAYAVEGLLERGYRVHLVTDAVKPINEEKGLTLMARWNAKGVEMVKTVDVVEGDLLAGLG